MALAAALPAPEVRAAAVAKTWARREQDKSGVGVWHGGVVEKSPVPTLFSFFGA